MSEQWFPFATSPAGTASFPSYRFSGTHRGIGQQYGEACADAIVKHRDLAVERLSTHSNVSVQSALAATSAYREFVIEHAEFLDEEIQGVAEGSGLSLTEAYLLQLRAELHQHDYTTVDAPGECTTFAVLADAAADRTPLVGQNADLPAPYTQIAVVIHLVPDHGPEVLMLTPAGQVSYIGINDRGLGVFGNFLNCDGWRVGFPRYLLTRLALLHDTVKGAVEAVRDVPRASSRNLIMLDAHNTAVDIETTPKGTARLYPEHGILAHSNHFLGEELLAEERAAPPRLENSRVRYDRMRELLAANHGAIDALTMQRILRDRDDVPDALCIIPGDEDTDNITFASVIAEPTLGQLSVAVGPPNEHPYTCYRFSKEIPDDR
jgi:isopenicillin-N N-acyltransferase-like protein